MPWQKTVMNTGESTLATTIGEMAEQFRTQDVSQRMTKYEDVKFVGQDVLDDQPVGVYKFKLEGTKGPSAGQIWISTADDLPRKIEHKQVLGRTLIRGSSPLRTTTTTPLSTSCRRSETE